PGGREAGVLLDSGQGGAQSPIDRRTEGDQPQQVESAREGRTPVPRHQAGLRLRQGPISRVGEEHASRAGDLRVGKPLHDAPSRAETPGSVMRLLSQIRATRGTERGQTRLVKLSTKRLERLTEPDYR